MHKNTKEPHLQPNLETHTVQSKTKWHSQQTFTNRFSGLRDSSVGKVLKWHCRKPWVQSNASEVVEGHTATQHTRWGGAQVQGHSLLGGEFEASLRVLSKEKVKKLIFISTRKTCKSLFIKERKYSITKLLCIKICTNKYVQIHRLGNLFLALPDRADTDLRSCYDFHNATFLAP